MAKVQLQAVGTVHEVDEHGQLVIYHPGDWFKTGKQRAIELLETRQAKLPDQEQVKAIVKEDLADCGILSLGESDLSAIVNQYELKHAMAEYPKLPFGRTLIIAPHLTLSPQHVAVGFVRIERRKGAYASWEMAAMLRSESITAAQIGTEDDQKATLNLVGTIALPVYDTSAVWIRKTRDTERMVEAWVQNLQDGVGDEHAFLQALYQHKILICSLPTGWLGRWLPTTEA